MKAVGDRTAGDATAGADRFRRVLRAEWTKFRTVRGWVIAVFLAAVVMVLLSVAGASGSKFEICTNNHCVVGASRYAVGPGGEPVVDLYYLVHRTLDGNGSLTVRLTSLTGETLTAGNGTGVNVGAGGTTSSGFPPGTPGVQKWSKAGLIVEASTAQGAAYAAVMVTGGHGVRLQYDYTGDIAGTSATVSAASPRWLRLTRTGRTLTGYESPDGRHWTEVGAVQLSLPETVKAGLFVTSPQYTTNTQHVGGENGSTYATLATATFDHLGTSGPFAPGDWTGTDVQAPPGPFSSPYPAAGGGLRRHGSQFVVIGSGDIAPATGLIDVTETSLVGSFLGLIVLIVLAALFITSEYRRGLILTTLTASPRRGRVLAAKSVVIGGVTFVAGLVAGLVTTPLFNHFWSENGNVLYNVSPLTHVRVIVGTAAMLAVISVLVLAVATILRRGAGAVAGGIVFVVFPFILSRASVLPVAVADWMLRLTPAAAFAIQQSLPRYSQVTGYYTPGQGYFPLSPWEGFAVLCAYTAVAVAIATHLLRVRDA